MAARLCAALLLLTAAAQAQYQSSQYYPAQATPSTGTGTTSTQYNSSGNVLSNPLYSTPSQGAAGTGIGVATPASSAASPGVASSPGAGLTYTPSNVLGKVRSAPAPSTATGTYPGYSSFTPASIGTGVVYNGAQAPRTSNILPAQSQDAYGLTPTVYTPVTPSAASGPASALGTGTLGTATGTSGPAAAPTAGGLVAAPVSGRGAFASAPAPGQATNAALGPQGARAAQNTSFGETQLTGVGPIYKKQDSLEPFYANLYGIPVPAGMADPDIFITLEVLGGSTDVGLYCNPGWGQYADVNANYPQPGYAVWQSDLSNDVDTVFISKNDRLYRPPYAREPNTTAYANYQPYFICSVINMDSQLQVSYRLEADLINNRGGLSALEQRALSNIFNNCCSGSSAVCADWKARNAKEGKLFTDWCSFPGQICTANGTLLRLDMRGFNLQCPFPFSDMAVFTDLTTLNLGRNPNVTGAVVDVFTALSNAQGLRHLNLYHDYGLTGPLVPPLSGVRSGLCAMVKRGLTGLTADGVGITGSLPSCLFTNGSRLTELHLGNNNLTGAIPDVIRPNSPLQVMTLYNNQLTGTIPSTIGNAVVLSNFDMSSNSLTGTIPAALGNITTLKYAVMKFNNLTGSIPSSLATNVNLETLDVKGNQLTRLPREWITGYPQVVNSSLVNVRYSFNQIRGPFPAALAQAPQLTFLVINNNTASGPLPGGNISNVSNLTNFFPALRAFNASHNQFTGSLPAAFGQSGIFTLQPLQFADGEILMHVFDISANRLSGSLPPFLDFTNVPEYAQRGIYISGNNFTYSCVAQVAYINDICLTSAAPAPSPSRVPPLAVSTVGSHTATGGVPHTNYTLPALNSSTPGVVYNGGVPGNPGAPTLAPNNANAQSEGNPAHLASPPPAVKHGLGGGQIAGIIIGVLLALAAVAAAGLLLMRRQKRVAGAPSGNGKLGGMGGLGGLGRGGNNKFERFDDGLQMSESTRRMEGFGSGR